MVTLLCLLLPVLQVLSSNALPFNLFLLSGVLVSNPHNHADKNVRSNAEILAQEGTMVVVQWGNTGVTQEGTMVVVQ